MAATIAVMAYLGGHPNENGSTKKQTVSGGAVDTKVAENSNAVEVVARGVSVVPGAIVCPDFATFKLTFSLYTESWSEKWVNTMTNGLSGAVDGPPIAPPDFERNGCALVPSGAAMNLQSNNGAWSVVTAKLPSGKTIRGVTLPSMTDYPPEVRKKQQELQQAQGKHYDEIMQPEIERHAAAVKQEHDLHVVVMRHLNPLYIEVPGSSVDCIATNCQQESQRHADAIQQENAVFLSRSQEARRQAQNPAHPSQP